jgi:hypothetical protein
VPCASPEAHTLTRIDWPHQREAAVELRDKLLKACERLGIPVEFKARVVDSDGNECVGVCSSKKVEILSTLAVIESCGTLAHELAHWGMHYDGEGRDLGLPPEIEEQEARMVERCLLERYGVIPAHQHRMTPRLCGAVDRLMHEVEQSEFEDVSAALHEFMGALGRSTLCLR